MTDKTNSIWKNKNFLLLYIGGLVSRLGSGIHNIALVWFILELTGSGTATGTILLLSTLPAVLIGPFGGLLADRVNRKLLIVGNDFFRGVIVLGLGLLIYNGSSSFLLLGGATVLISISGSFFNPAVSAVFPNLVTEENLEKANSLEHISLNFTQIVGAILGGILIGILGIPGAFIFNGISFLISGISELFIEIPPIEVSTETPTFLQDFKFGLKFIKERKEIMALFIVSLFLNFLFSGLFAVGLPYIYNQILEVDSMMFGLAKSVFPIGAILGSVLINYYIIKNYRSFIAKCIFMQSFLLMTLGLPISPLALNGLSIINIYLILLVILFTIGVINALSNIPVITLFQKMIPDSLRGRLFGLLGTFSQGLVPVSMGLVGIIMDNISPFSLFIMAGIMSMILSYSIVKIPAFEYFEQKDSGVASASVSKVQ